MPIVLKLYRCFGSGLKICICFGYNPQIFFTFNPQIDFSSFLGVYYYQYMNFLRIKFFFLFCVLRLPYLFQDSSSIKRQT